MTHGLQAAGAALGVLLASCASLVAPPEVRLEGDPARAWERVLERFVDERGRIDFDGLARDPQDLHQVVAWIAAESPPSRPERYATPAEALAWWINAYNALAMYNVLYAGVPPRKKVRFFYLRELVVGGRPISLYDLENDVIRPLGEERVHFALNCMVRSCPRLPREPFRAADLERQLDAAAREFFAAQRNVVPDAERRVVRFNAILDFYTEDFLARAPSLIAYANRYRDEPLPADWEHAFLDYDWTLNRQPEPGP